MAKDITSANYPSITIKEARRKNNLTKREMAELLNVESYVYNLFEKYKREFYITEAIKFSKLTKVPFLQLIFTIDDFTNKNRTLHMDLPQNHHTKILTLKQARAIIGLNMEEFAPLIGYSVRNYIEYENYRREFKVSKAIKFSEITGIPIENIKFEIDNFKDS